MTFSSSSLPPQPPDRSPAPPAPPAPRPADPAPAEARHQPPLPGAYPPRWEFRCFGLLFALALLTHAWFATVNWRSTVLPAHEYRETHTAITALFIQRDHNFSLSYPTPVLGKPWSIPYEFPFYQWAAVGLSNATGLPLIPAGRLVSLACFYLCLPAVWLLLGRLALPASRRFLVLILALTCPLYVFVARAFLIETTALLFSVWFLVGFVFTLQRRQLGWLALANLAGVGAGLGKVTTFMLWLIPAGAFAVVSLWRDRPRRPVADLARAAFWPTAGWILACVALPFAATWWWIDYTDAVKALNVSAAPLASSARNSYYFGTLPMRFAAEPWLTHGHLILHSVLAPLGLALFAGCIPLAGRWRRWILGGAAVFAAGPLIFPILYAWHEYYFVADSLFLLTAAGLAFNALLDSPRRRWLALPVFLLFVGAQGRNYLHELYPSQVSVGRGGEDLALVVQDATDPADVLVIAGQDWSPVIPFYAGRRALMIRRGRENEPDYLLQAFADLHGESVPLLLVTGPVRDNHSFIDQAVKTFELDHEPLFTWRDTIVYVSHRRRAEICRNLFNVGYAGVIFTRPGERLSSPDPQLVSSVRSARLFAAMTPSPVRYQVPFCLSDFGLRENLPLFTLHATTRLWFEPASDVSQLTLDFGVLDDAYANPRARTDGVEIGVLEQHADGSTRPIFARFLDPFHRPTDRGPQQVVLRLVPEAGTTGYVVESRPGPAGDASFDWAYLARIEFR